MSVVQLVALADYRPEGVLRDCLGHHDDAMFGATRRINVLIALA